MKAVSYTHLDVYKRQHFNQANEDVRQSMVSIEKIESRGERITQVELGAPAAAAAAAASNVIPAPMTRKLEAGE